MESLYLKNFKAYRDEFEKLNLTNKNFLLYGENGSGKSSLYEAIKITFFREKIAKNIPIATTPEEQQRMTDSFWNSYKNNKATAPFEVTLNDISYRDFDATSYQLFMIAMDKLCMENALQLSTLLTKIEGNFGDDIAIDEFNINKTPIERFCSKYFSEIESTVNVKLAEFREENIEIVIDNEDDYKIKIHDTVRNLEYKENVTHYFNEAKLNLIVLLLLLESIKKAQQSDKTKILVLDDFITSLDVSNRTFLMRYILEDFSEFQILILTHNVYFYNLIMYLVNDIYKKKNNDWIFANLYEIENKHKLYIKGGIETVANIKDFYHNNNGDPESVGNKIRQRFEVLLYEFSKLLMVGAVEDSKKIMQRIEDAKNIYFNNKKTASDLIDELEKLLNSDNTNNLPNRLTQKIAHYKKDGFKDFQKIVRDLKLYRKVTLHPLSHGAMGQSSFTTTDLEQSLELLEKFESYIKDLIGSDVDGA